MTLALELAQRITAMDYLEIPAEAIAWAKVSIVDTIGCALAGAAEEAPGIVRQVLAAGCGGSGSLLWGTSARTSPLTAATINGTAAHALDYDDIGNSMAGHPSAVLLPAAIALAEDLHSNGRELLVAYIVGFETQARIGRAVHMCHYEKGWHPTATLGIFGATAACARLLNLDAGRTAIALAIAVSLAAGVKANFGTMTKPLHAGQSTQHGLYAALLARDGFTASLNAFEHKQGFFEVFNGTGNYEMSRVLEGWADPLDILDPGVGLKQYPCCGGTHSAIDAMILLRQEHNIRPEDVASIVSIIHERALVHTNRPDPGSALDAKFSVQYCIARALMHGDVTFSHFDGQSHRDPDVRQILKRITTQPHPHKPKGMHDHYECEIKVTLIDGRSFSARVDQPLRGPKNLVPPDRLEAKFHDCATRSLNPDKIPQIYEALQQIETCPDVRTLTTLLERASASPKISLAAV